ncbi:MAG: hypothetical protein WBM50_12715, partial [Acidimicrobiales bacterium]
MDRESEDGEGMEPSDSVDDEYPASAPDGEATSDGITIVDSEGGRPSEPAKPTFPSARRSNDDQQGVSVNGGADPISEADPDPMSVDQWLAEAGADRSSASGDSIVAPAATIATGAPANAGRD